MRVGNETQSAEWSEKVFKEPDKGKSKGAHIGAPLRYAKMMFGVGDADAMYRVPT